MSILAAGAISAIADVPGLYISDITVPRSPDLLRKYGITHVLTLTSERDCPEIGAELGIEHLHVALEDRDLEDLVVCLDGLCAWIEHALRPGGADEATNGCDSASSSPTGSGIIPGSVGGNRDTRELASGKGGRSGHGVLVHCQQGISRSGAVVVAYIMRALAIEYDSALSLVRKYRPAVMPNGGFADQLRFWRRMRCRLYVKTGDDGGGKMETKPEYEVWESNRGILRTKAQEQAKGVMMERMKNMVTIFGFGGRD